MLDPWSPSGLWDEKVFFFVPKETGIDPVTGHPFYLLEAGHEIVLRVSVGGQLSAQDVWFTYDSEDFPAKISFEASDCGDVVPPGELQILSRVGSDVTLSDGGGTVSINDADANPANELNTSVALNGTNLEVTDAGGALGADLSSLVNDNDWTDDGTNVYRTSGNVGVGTANPIATLNVVGSTSLDGAVTIRDTQGQTFWQFGTSHPATLTGGYLVPIVCGLDRVLTSPCYPPHPPTMWSSKESSVLEQRVL